MLANQQYEGVMEIKRYAIRFIQQLDGIEHIKGNTRTKYNQYDSVIRPLIKWLEDKGVTFLTNTTVEEIHVEVKGEKKTVTYLDVVQNGQHRQVPVAASDLVYFTNGSMTQNSTQGNLKQVAVLNRDTKQRGCFSVWEKLAKVSRSSGNLRNSLQPLIRVTGSATRSR